MGEYNANLAHNETLGSAEVVEQRLEEEVLTKIGRSHYIPMPVQIGGRRVYNGTELVCGRNFLDAYPTGSPHRQATEDMLQGFAGMEPTEDGYAQSSDYLVRMIDPFFIAPAKA